MDRSLTAHPDAIDPRISLRVYAAAATLAGLGLVGWGPRWFGGDLVGEPLNQAALIRMFGSMIAAVGCLSAGLAAADDPSSARRGLAWLIAAHVVVGAVLLTQRIAIWGPDRAADAALALIAAAVMSLLYVLLTSEGEVGQRPFALTTLFGDRGPTSANGLRSRYEQQIREAARQEERNRLARDLHDSVKQQIFAIHTSAAAAQARLDADVPGTRAALDQVRTSAREAMTELEAMLDQLRATPVGATGLVEALARHGEALQFRTGAQVRVTHDALPPEEAFDPGAHQALFRVAQEALANVGRHARATDVHVSLQTSGGRLTLEIQDNGVGFDRTQQRSGMGIANMQARAEEIGGTLTVAARPGAGTTVRCSVPYVTPDDRAVARRQMLRRGAMWLWLGAFNLLFVRAASPLGFGVAVGLAAVAAIGLARCVAGYRRLNRPREVMR